MPRARDRHFEEFREHTRLKHLILSTYLRAWGMILLRFWDKIWFVDAFAGAGQDERGNPGSPLIAVRTAHELRQDWQQREPSRPRRLSVVAIEKDHNRFEELNRLLAEFTAASADPRAYVREGSLEAYADGLLSHIATAPTLYFLDPCGVDGLQADLLPRLLAGEHNEIFALFSDTGATRLVGVLTTEDVDVDSAIARGMMQRNLFEELNREEEEELRQAAENRSDALDCTRPVAQRILTEALGSGDWLQEIEATPVHERPIRFVQLFMELLIAAGARFVIALPMYDSSARRIYTLVHASKSPTAFEEMKGAMSYGLKHGGLPDDVRAIMTRALETDLDQAAQAIAQHFAGREVPWTSDDNSVDSVKRFATQHTAVFPPQLTALRQKLETLGLRIPGKKVIFRFPSESPS